MTAFFRLCAAAALCLSACSSRPPDFGHVNQGASSRGLFSLGFEQHRYVPCATDRTWWWSVAYPEDPDWQDVDALLGASCDKNEDPYCGWVYMEVDGSVSEPGKHGHLGMYERELVVSRIHYASLTVPADCRRRPP